MSYPYTGHVWHKGSEKQPWMRKFVIVKDSVVRIYGTRNDHVQQREPLVVLELISNTKFMIGSDNVCHIGWMTKKGIINWNPRWCILLRTGYISYVDAEAKHEVRNVDLLNAVVTPQLEPQLQLNIKGAKGGNFQFRLENKKEFQEWYAKITEVQKECARMRKEYSGGNQPTLFPFMLVKEFENSNVNNGNQKKSKHIRQQSNYHNRVCHYFCCDSEDGLYTWQKALEANISYNNDKNKLNVGGTKKKPGASDKIAIGGKSGGARRQGSTPKARSSKIMARSAMAPVLQQRESREDNGKVSDGGKMRLVNSLSNRMSFGGSKSEDDAVDSDDEEISFNTPDDRIDRKFRKLVKDLRLPQAAAANMLKLPKAQKIQMIKAAKVKEQGRQRESGKAWAEKLRNDRGVTANTLQTFGVVLRDENERFVKDFIAELGLNHLCRLGNKSNMSLDKELLNVFKAIIDTEQTTTSLINHDLVVRMIVQKIDSKDPRVRELALQLLVSLVAVDTELTTKAVTDVMACMYYI